MYGESGGRGVEGARCGVGLSTVCRRCGGGLRLRSRRELGVGKRG